jgi:hypothetical protein
MEKFNTINMKIGEIEITNTGIRIELPFSEGSTPFFKKLDTSNFLKIAKCLAKARMAHCHKELMLHIHEAHRTPFIISWDGGHFTIPVYQALERVLELDDVYKLDSLQTQQLIRAIVLNTSGMYVSDYEQHQKIKGSEIRITNEFKLFLTEHQLVCDKYEG